MTVIFEWNDDESWEYIANVKGYTRRFINSKA